MCDKGVHLRKKREKKSDEFDTDASFIVKKSHFKHIKGHPREEYVPTWPKPLPRLYPKANNYYAFHEDANPFTRFFDSTLSDDHENTLPHFPPSEEPFASRDPYLATETRRKYLEREPTCFVMLGKPDLNTMKLASMIATTWKCILICPVYLIKLEIEEGSEKGRLMANILKLGGCVGPDIIMNLIINRLNRRDVHYKGYIVEGLPLIPNKTLDYSSYLPMDEAAISVAYSNTMRYFNPSFEMTCSGGMVERGETRDSRGGCVVEANYEEFTSSQIEDIFSRWPLKPTLIIYLMCPDVDHVKKRNHFRLNPLIGRIIDTSFLDMADKIQMLFDHEKTRHYMNASYELYKELMDEERILDEDHGKYLLRRMSDEPSNVEAQCELYKRLVMPAINKRILLHNPQNVIRLDGRSPLAFMFRTLSARLRTLPIRRVILPTRMVENAMTLDEESSPLHGDEFEGRSNEEAYRDLANRETVSPLFPWRLSTWNFLCPVELTRGRTRSGNPRHSVRFMNKIFFLSSSKAVELFLENPRTFLHPFQPRPTCKVVVFGPDYSGKSELCRELARELGGAVINVKEARRSPFDADPGREAGFYLTSGSESDAIVERVKAIPGERIDEDVWRDGGYVVDGMYPNVDSWNVVRDSGVVFEDAILLVDEEPYDHLTSKWRDMFEGRNGEALDRRWREDEDEEEYVEGLFEYIRHVQQFYFDWKTIEEMVADSCQTLIPCNVGKLADVSAHAIRRIKDRYTDKARLMTEEEKEREKFLAEYVGMADVTVDLEEEEEEEGEGKQVVGDAKQAANLRFGDTADYCPVALIRYNVFWKGKEEFGAIFMDKIYHCSNSEALEEFLRDPRALNLPLRKPPSTVPPLRVSVIGPTGSGRSTLSDAISRECGLVHVDYFDCFTAYMRLRAMPPITDKDAIIMTRGGLLEPAELPEDLNDERYNSDPRIVQTLVRRYWSEGGHLPPRMRRECLLDYFNGLYNKSGLVLDQFPSCPQDVETALKHYAVPEVVLELRCGKETATQRTLGELFSSWEKNLEAEKEVESERYAMELKHYESRRDDWVEETLAREAEMLDPEEYDGEEEMESRRYELEEIWYQTNPEPVLFTDWEDFETAKGRIEEEFSRKYDSEAERVSAVRESLVDESIPYFVIDAEKSPRDVFLQAMQILEPYARRTASTLEQISSIDVETADTLLDCGYYFLSSFGRWCPVQLHRNQIPLQMFLPLEITEDIYPVIHRQYVYFLGGKEAQEEFLKDPYKYLEQDSCAPVIQFRIAVIGPPKCGKTTLAQRFADKYNLKVITRGSALRYIIKYFPLVESAELVESELRMGRMAPMEQMKRAIEMYSIDPSIISQGFVLDGFPMSRKEYELLTYLGMQPMVILDLISDLEFSLDCLSRDGDDEISKPPRFSKRFLAHLYDVWRIDQGSYRRWLRRFNQNVIEVDATRCMWHVWTRADENVCSRYLGIRKYFRECDYEKVHCLRYMSVSPYEFRSKQSGFRSYCPLCLYHEDALTRSEVPDHRGTVQFREHLYWVCPEHMDEFVQDPQRYLPPVSTKQLPGERPRVLTETIDLEHPCWVKRLRVKGLCSVTYLDHLPSRDVVRGKLDTGVLYRDNVYLFCSNACRDKFMEKPDKYADVVINFTRTLAPIDPRSLPNLGFLEQTVASLIIDAINQVSVSRPKFPGMSPSATAAIFIGTYLKAKNAPVSRETELYRAVNERIYGYEKILKLASRMMKQILNPFLSVNEHKRPRAYGYTLSQLSVISHDPKRDTNYVSFCRTSPTQILVDFDENDQESNMNIYDVDLHFNLD